jgi:hypothetical protein
MRLDFASQSSLCQVDFSVTRFAITTIRHRSQTRNGKATQTLATGQASLGSTYLGAAAKAGRPAPPLPGPFNSVGESGSSAKDAFDVTYLDQADY